MIMSNEPMKIPVNYGEAAETLTTLLGLKGSPVALKFAPSKEDIPAGMVELDKTIRHCSMVNLARTEGKIFYAPAEKHECNGGAWSLGLREITPTLKNGEFYFKLGKYDSAACLQTDHREGHASWPGRDVCHALCPARKDAVYPAGLLIVTTPEKHAQARPEYALPARREDLCGVLRHPVGLFGRNSTDLSYRADRTSRWAAMVHGSSPALLTTRW